MSEMTDKDRETKKELIESIQSILDANKLNHQRLLNLPCYI